MPNAQCPRHVGYLMLLRKAIYRFFDFHSPSQESHSLKYPGVEIRQCHYLWFNCAYIYQRKDVRNYRKLVMATNESQINQIYASENVQGILQLAIDFYGYKVRIHVLCDRAIGKCFWFHHRTPVTARVAN